jgi:hypothetical protein
MAKTDSSIYVFDRAGLIIFKAPAKAGAALFAFSDDGDSGLAYLVREGNLLHWSGRSLVPVALDADAIGGDVLTIAQPSPAFGSMLVERGGRLWQLHIALTSGAIDTQHVVPGITAPVLLLNDGGLVSVDANGIQLRQVNGTGTRFDARLSKNVLLRRMGAGWVQICDSAGHGFALRLEKDRGRLYQLPEERP